MDRTKRRVLASGHSNAPACVAADRGVALFAPSHRSAAAGVHDLAIPVPCPLVRPTPSLYLTVPSGRRRAPGFRARPHQEATARRESPCPFPTQEIARGRRQDRLVGRFGGRRQHPRQGPGPLRHRAPGRSGPSQRPRREWGEQASGGQADLLTARPFRRSSEFTVFPLKCAPAVVDGLTTRQQNRPGPVGQAHRGHGSAHDERSCRSNEVHGSPTGDEVNQPVGGQHRRAALIGEPAEAANRLQASLLDAGRDRYRRAPKTCQTRISRTSS